MELENTEHTGGCWMFLQDGSLFSWGCLMRCKSRLIPASAINQNAFPSSDEGKAEVRVNRKSILAIGITPSLFDSYHE
jgi:hypothetical protein